MTKMKTSSISHVTLLALLLLGIATRNVQSLPKLVQDVEQLVEDVLDHSYIVEFVTKQFMDWQGASNCTAFVDSFDDPFQYCDATPECITTKDDLLTNCNTLASLTGTHSLLVVKPSWTPVADYSRIAVTGQQNVHPELACFDFSVRENLVFTTKDNGEVIVKSTKWEGFYTIAPGGCNFHNEEQEL